MNTSQPLPPEAKVVTIQELIDRCKVQASKFGERSNTRLLLFNCMNAMTDLAVRLDRAHQLIELLPNEDREKLIEQLREKLGKAEVADSMPEPAKPKSKLILLPSSEGSL